KMAYSYDYIIVGSGIAGLYAALLGREHGSVLVLTKGSIDDCNTRWAQGGIAAPIGAGDSAEKHLRDTIDAGAGLVDEEAARVLTSEAAARIEDLVRLGVPFDTQDGEIALAREGAHSQARVLHAGGDSTGAHIELTLASLARQEGITVLEHTIALEILTESPDPAHPSRRLPPHPEPIRGSSGRTGGGALAVRAVRALNAMTDEASEYSCRHLILATGGAGQMYRVSTNPAVATGDGIALAYRAGAEVTDMEFVQFHPTALRLPGVQPFLISEAVRGEGGTLRDVRDERVMPEYDERAELAPRDGVARATVEAPGGSAPGTPGALDISDPAASESGPPAREAVQSLMWDNAGIVREAGGLAQAKAALSAWDGALTRERSEGDPRVALTDRAG